MTDDRTPAWGQPAGQPLGATPPAGPPGPPPEQPRRRGVPGWLKGAGLFLVGLLLGGLASGGTEQTASPAPAETVTEVVTEQADEVAAAPAPTETVTEVATVTVTEQAAAPAPPPEPEGLSDGVYIVGEDVQPGRYRTDGASAIGSSVCYYAFLNSTNTTDYITNGLSEGPQVFDLTADVPVLELSGGCTWTAG